MSAPSEPLASRSLLRALRLAVTAVVGLVAALRPLCAGQVAAEPETVLLDALVWFAVFVWLLRKCLAQEGGLAGARFLLPVGLFALFVALAVVRAWTDGNGRAALDMGLAWAADLALFLLVIDIFRQPDRFRLLVACLLAGLAVGAAYGLYQRTYGTDYFRRTLEADPQSVEAVTGHSEVHQRLYRGRVASDRVGGTFGYPNALADFCLLLLPALGGLLLARGEGESARWRRGVLGLVAVAVVLVLVLTGSKAGFLTAKAVELFALVFLVPAGRRTAKRVGGLLCGVTLGTVVGLALAVLGFVLSGRALWVGQVLFAAAWIAEFVWLQARARAAAPFGRRAVGLGAVVLAAGVIGGIGLFAGVGLGKADKTSDATPVPARLAALRAEALKHVTVRLNYWKAAVAMIREYPLRGVGLDNFGYRYTQYKRPAGWAVKRVHNHYLQLAADGGVGLLAAFLLVWGFLYGRRDRGGPVPAEPAEPGTERTRAQLGKLGYSVGLGAFVLVYVLFLRGLFMGLSVEFFFNELNAAPGTGSVRAATGAWTAAWIHGGTHFLLFPGLWCMVFAVAWRRGMSLDPSGLRPWLLLGVGAVLLHAVADFTLMNGSLSTLTWMVAGLAIAAGPASASQRRLSRPVAGLSAVLVVAGFFVLFHTVVLRHMEGVFAARVAEVERDGLLREDDPDKREERFAAVLAAHAEALRLRPRDSELHRHRAELLLTRLHQEMQRQLPPGLSPARARIEAERLMRAADPRQKEAIVAAWRRVVACNPYFASGYAMLARRLVGLYPGRRDRMEEAAALLGRAVELHPYKPLYRFQRARLQADLGRAEAAAKLLEAALAVDEHITDERAKLTPDERREARYGLTRLRAGRAWR